MAHLPVIKPTGILRDLGTSALLLHHRHKMASVGETRAPSSPTAFAEDGAATAPKYNWYRGVFFQATVVGIAAFTAPGLWNAMNSVGAGGQQSPYLVM